MVGFLPAQISEKTSNHRKETPPPLSPYLDFNLKKNQKLGTPNHWPEHLKRVEVFKNAPFGWILFRKFHFELNHHHDAQALVCSCDAAPSGGAPRGGAPRGVAAVLQRDTSGSPRTWRVQRARRVPCALRSPLCTGSDLKSDSDSHGLKPAWFGHGRCALPYRPLCFAVLSATGRRRAEHRCAGRCACGRPRAAS